MCVNVHMYIQLHKCTQYIHAYILKSSKYPGVCVFMCIPTYVCIYTKELFYVHIELCSITNYQFRYIPHMLRTYHSSAVITVY